MPHLPPMVSNRRINFNYSMILIRSLVKWHSILSSLSGITLQFPFDRSTKIMLQTQSLLFPTAVSTQQRSRTVQRGKKPINRGINRTDRRESSDRFCVVIVLSLHLRAPLMARCRKSGRVYGGVVFLGCCAFAEIDRHANESNERPLLSPLPSPLTRHPMESLSSSSAAHLERYSPRWTDTVPPPVAPHAVPAPASHPGNVYLFIRCTRHPGVVG